MTFLKSYRLLVLLVFYLLYVGQPTALQAQGKDGQTDIYTSDKVLEFILSADYNTLLKDRGDERSYHPAILSYTDTDGLVTVINLKVMVRGNRRRDPTVCGFPPLMLNFPRKSIKHTIFKDINKVKLVTHCINEDYVMREYLVYKLYNVLTENSFRVRLCRITYQDLNQKRKTEQKLAFLIEDDNDVAARNKGKKVPDKLIINMSETDEDATALLCYFQYMIGNTDWSVPYRHNIKLYTTSLSTPPIPVPYDFDYSGIVSAPYAQPPPEFNLSSVRQRLFRGYTYPELVTQKTINTFNARRTSLYGVYQQNGLLSRSYQKSTFKYLDAFFETINSPKKHESRIQKQAAKNEKLYISVKGL